MERQAINDLKKDQNIIVLPADKGKIAVVLDTEVYESKVNDLLCWVRKLRRAIQDNDFPSSKNSVSEYLVTKRCFPYFKFQHPVWKWRLAELQTNHQKGSDIKVTIDQKFRIGWIRARSKRNAMTQIGKSVTAAIGGGGR